MLETRCVGDGFGRFVHHIPYLFVLALGTNIKKHYHHPISVTNIQKSSTNLTHDVTNITVTVSDLKIRNSLNLTNTISKYEWILIKFSVGCHLFHSTNTLVQHFSCFAVVLLLFTRLL